MSNFKELVRIGKDAESRYTQGGKTVLGFSAAFDTGWGDDKKTMWLDCSAWGERFAKVAEYLKKGTQIVVEGDIGSREYNDKTYFTLDVREIKLVGKQEKGDSRPAEGQRNAPSSPKSDEPFPDDDIPF